MGKTAFEHRTNAYTFDPNDLVLVSDPDDQLYDPRVELPVDEGLVKSIMYHGFVGSVVIAKRGDEPVVVAGRQRVKAAREANERLTEQGKEPVRVTAVIRRGDEVDLYGVALSENENRQDDSPMAKAKKCAKYINMGRSEDEAAIAFGVTKQAINSWLKLLECSAPVRKAVESGQLASSAATKLAELPAAEQKDALAELMSAAPAGKKPTAKTAAAVAKKRGSKNGTSVRRGTKEIRAKLEETGLPRGFKDGLLWVLGEG